MESITDNALMQKVKMNDLDKLGLLYERYKGQLFGFFFNMNRDKDLSEDLVQNVFIRVIKYKHSFKGDGEFKTWLFHIARNANYDCYKKNKRTETVRLDDTCQVQIVEDNNLAVEKENNLQLLEKAIDKLDYDKKELLTMSKLKRMKYKEIGEVIGCTEGSVKVKVFRALKELKVVYEQVLLETN
ncbi:MAG: RNA polymerase sigma factor [Cyclobacteriaceae bacterium]|nr:RNA polymerase sigma factor [Cyclobacteriaceae bacterium]